MKELVFVFVFILLSTFNFEFLINRESDTAVTLLAAIVEAVMFYFLIFKPVKKLFSK